MRWRVILVLLLVGLLGWLTKPVVAETNCEGLGGEPLYECLGRQIADLSKALADSKAATAPLESEVSRLEREIASIQRQIGAAEDRLDDLADEIEDREKDLAVQYLLLAEKTKGYYKRMRTSSGAVEWLLAVGSGELQQELGYREVAVNQDRVMIASLAEEIAGLESDRADLEMSKTRLSGLQASLDKEADFFKKEIAGAKEYQKSLEGKIASLSALQQSVLSAKAETFSTTVGDVPLADDYNASIEGFRNAAPGGSFAVFSFGAPHFKGMSQYGAYGRAKAGQSAEEILKAYYGNVRIETVDTSFSINTSAGSLPFEDNYMRGISEMPSSWADKGGMAALEAQAIAARSYALSYVGWRMGNRSASGSICTTESCQVYRSSKVGDAKWGEAVNNTKGKILVSNDTGEIISAWYASTSGGYQESYQTLGHTTPGFWDAEGGRSGWTSNAWESRAGSPWFYKAWYKSRSGDMCGRDNPWLSGEEMADIINAWVVVYQRGESDDRVTPIGSCWGGNPYSIAELKSKGGYGRVTGVSVTYRDDGVTDSVNFQTDKGSISIKGEEFYKAFNLRAPGRVAVKSGLFNIESK